MNPRAQWARVRLRAWGAPILGLVAGLAYGGVTSVIDLEALRAPRLFFVLDNILTFLLPALLGMLAGMVFNDLRRQTRTNRILSTQNAKLQGELLTHLLGSHILHEIRNPLHNLTAVLEEWPQRVPPEALSIIQRNLLRLQVITNQLSHWSSLNATIDLRQTVLLRPWLDEFLSDKVRPQLNQGNIRLEEDLEPVRVAIHPLLLEQCFVALFNNAFEAVSGHDVRVIHVSVKSSRERPGHAEIELRNTGALYPEAVLAAQAAQPQSDHAGPGLGLLLVHRTLEHVGGSLLLANVGAEARTVLWIPEGAV